MDIIIKVGLLLLATVAMAVVAAVVLALPVMLLWDYVMPPLFHVHTITFWQALALTLLCGLLFKPTGASKSEK